MSSPYTAKKKRKLIILSIIEKVLPSPSQIRARGEIEQVMCGAIFPHVRSS
tara:strand:+ start:353 stop:505 length:153 start_codon:yes stop_codon:yes gene_type:complete